MTQGVIREPRDQILVGQAKPGLPEAFATGENACTPLTRRLASGSRLFARGYLSFPIPAMFGSIKHLTRPPLPGRPRFFLRDRAQKYASK